MRHSMFRGALVLLGSLALFAARVSAFDVGDKPALSGKSGKGDKIELSQFSGKIVVVDFWATWCGPCMAEAPHMVEVNKKWSSQGLQFLGVSLDQDAAKMVTVAKEKGLDWPHILGVGSPSVAAWSVNSIPRTFVIGPDGSILWTGHPGNGLDGAIEKAFKEHPPILVDPKIVTAANTALDQVDSAVKNKDFMGAMKLLGKVSPDALKDKQFASRLGEVQKGLGEFADSMLAEVDPLISSQQYPAAIAKLRDLSAKLSGTPAGVKAREKLASLASNPEARKQIEAADRAEKGDAALQVAQKLKADKKDAAAYARFKEIVTQFAGTPAATTAAATVAEYEKDPAFVKNVIGSQNESKAKGLLGMADSYRGAAKTEQAKKKYQEVIAQFPGTPQAEKAKAALAEIGG